jgi:hypothetical protein
MEEQFVTYEIALKLKELGFDKPCFFAFDNCQMRCKDLRTNEQEFEGVNYNSSILYISQPLWQQAIEFLKSRKVLVAELWDGWEYGMYDEDFIYCETREQAVTRAIQILEAQIIH